MFHTLLSTFKKIWFYDFEYQSLDGENPIPICMVAQEIKSGQTIRLRLDAKTPYPFGADEDTLFVAYYGVAEVSCHLSLGWPLPNSLLDLFTEFRCMTNGIDGVGASLLSALAYHQIEAMGAAEKDDMRQLAIRGGPYTDQELRDLLAYCETDVQALVKLFNAMAPIIDVPRALLRGREMLDIAVIERNGIPIDTDTLDLLRTHWPVIKERLVERVDQAFGVYNGVSFSQKKFQSYLARKGIAWPRLVSRRLNLSDDTFREMAITHPAILPLKELRSTLGKLRLTTIAVGKDGRNRCMLSPFRSKTGRSQPSNSKFIFGPSVWMRSLIKPAEGSAVAYIDWSQQEFGIAAALSKDNAMMTAYLSGDPYLAFGVQAGAIPPDGTKQSHKTERERFKQCALAVQYGMGAESLGARVGKDRAYGAELLSLHRRTYPQFWRWNEATVTKARVEKSIASVYGWKLRLAKVTNDRTLANFPMQGNGAEMLRLAIMLAIDKGVKVCAPIHDAILIEAPIAEIETAVSLTQEAMRAASRAVLLGFELRSDVEVFRYPDRYIDPRGQQLWNDLRHILIEISKMGTGAHQMRTDAHQMAQ